MALVEMILIVVGLSLFEIITSIDNAIINAEVLGTMGQKARRWFLIWGILIAVFVVRGVLPFIILWLGNTEMSLSQLIDAGMSSDPEIIKVVEQSAPILLVGGGIFLVFLFFHWIFLEPKHYGIRGEEFIQRQGVWFFAVVSILLTIIVWQSIKIDPLMALGAVVGSSAFFITHGFKENAAEMEKRMLKEKSGMSDISKILYLEVIDATFSIDGVLGAFAFTFMVPLILIGNGIGAIVVRQLTLKNIENVKKYKYLKNGAMYSVLGLGVVMLLDSFGYHVPTWISPVLTIGFIAFFFYKSVRALKEGYTPARTH